MKKKLLLLCLILVCILALPQVVAAATSTTSATLTASQTDTIQITVTGTEFAWTLTPGQTFTESGVLNVVVNGPAGWSVAASDADTVNTNGFLTNYTGSVYILSPLTNLSHALKVNANGGSYVTLPSGGSIVTGAAVPQKSPIHSDSSR